MSDSVGDKPVSTLYRIIVGGILAIAVAALAIGIGTAAHAAQVRADAQKAMVAAAPAYDGAITLGGNLDQLAAQSVQAKAAYDAEQARVAAAAEAARVAAELQRQQETAAETQRQADESAAAEQQDANTSDDSSGPVKCPAGTHANAVDGAGNESACEANGPNGEVCQAYDDNNNCTNWYKP
ncbi:MAG: hypothetical protein AAGC66_04400 [Leifsonia sp.]